MELNKTTEWQNAINFADRHNAKYRHECRLKELKQKKLIHRVVDFALVGAMAIALNVIGLLNPYIAIGIAAICMSASSFALGRLFGETGGFKK